ncbi:MAG: peptidylprolyl isomerase [Planctomycetes bacterium]|nr:peptidylprolyl isomerase [Planctomycetota bacterium]
MSGTQIVSAGKVVSIHYKLKLDDGEVVDSSEGSAPLSYLHGAGNIVVGLERALEGSAVGNEVSVAVAPGDGYGEHEDGLVQTVPRNAFPDGARLKPGITFQAVDEDDHAMIGTITEVQGDQITVDFNHPLAGETLHFEVTIAGVRDSTDEERKHGHAHGPDGHGHHHHHH